MRHKLQYPPLLMSKSQIIIDIMIAIHINNHHSHHDDDGLQEVHDWQRVHERRFSTRSLVSVEILRMSKDGEFFICSSLLGLIVTKTIILITIKAFKDIKIVDQ